MYWWLTAAQSSLIVMLLLAVKVRDFLLAIGEWIFLMSPFSLHLMTMYYEVKQKKVHVLPKIALLTREHVDV